MNLLKVIKVVLTIPYWLLCSYSCLLCSYFSIKPVRNLLYGGAFWSAFLEASRGMMGQYVLTFIFGIVTCVFLIILYRRKKSYFVPLIVSIIPNVIMFFTVSGINDDYIYASNLKYLYWLLALCFAAYSVFLVYLLIPKQWLTQQINEIKENEI